MNIIITYYVLTFSLHILLDSERNVLISNIFYIVFYQILKIFWKILECSEKKKIMKQKKHPAYYLTDKPEYKYCASFMAAV